MAQIDLKNATVTLSDHLAVHTIAVAIGEGDLSWSEKRAVEYTLDKGVLDNVRLGDEEPVEVSLDATWDYVATKGAFLLADAIKGKTTGATLVTWVSTDIDSCKPYAIDIIVAYVPGCGVSAETETVTLSDFRWETLDYSFDNGTLSVSGRCNILEAEVSAIT